MLNFRWVEKWLRRWRGIFCSHSAQTSDEGRRSDIELSGGLSSLTGACRDTIRDLRNAKCSSKGKNPSPSVLQDIKTTLECDAFSSASKSDWASTQLVLIILCLLQFMIRQQWNTATGRMHWSRFWTCCNVTNPTFVFYGQCDWIFDFENNHRDI